MSKPTICIVSPALAAANNGNWQTASRWAAFLAPHHAVAIAASWPGEEGTEAAAPDLLIALHARRSAPSLAAFRAAYPDRPALLVLTGTDLYRDIHTDASAQESLHAADALVVLQSAGLDELPAGVRVKAHVIYQSAPPDLPAADAADTAAGTGSGSEAAVREIVMIGHLREEKDPLTFMRAATLVRAPSAKLIHVGGALTEALGEAAEAAQRNALGKYQWLGALPHDATRERLKTAHAMAICSQMEGGANVIIEAVTSGVPVLASDISGNRGMLGEDYAGYFHTGDAQALAALIDKSIQDEAFIAKLRQQCAARAGMFAPEVEAAGLLTLVDNLLHLSRKTPI